MINIHEKAKCSGCGACRDICSVRAIDLVADDEGFLYPRINIEECIKCGKCDRICPIENRRKKADEGNKIIAYAAQTKDEYIRQNSSSGGIFTEIATYIINNGGIVFGAAFDETFKVIHIGVDDTDNLERLRGSKYVQSEIGNTYAQVKTYLESERMVLFTGTPCQIAGLYSYLGKNYDNLYTQDIICHGVPSPMVWKKYVEFREKKAAAKLRRPFFRHKKYGWKKYSVQFQFTNGTEYIQDISDDLYMRGFLRNLCLRPSCYHCAFKSKNRAADITLADFWRIEKICPELDDDRGTSLVILHSSRGRELFDKIKDNLIYQKTDFEGAIKYNPAMTESVPVNSDRSAFMKCIKEDGFKSAEKRYLSIPFISRVRKKIKTITQSIRRDN